MLHHQCGWSLSRLTEGTGASKTMLGQIERNEPSPAVVTLRRIATGLNVLFSTSVSPPESEDTLTFGPQQRAMVVAPLFPRDPQLCFDHFSILLTPGALSESIPHETGVIEHAVVISDLLDICIERQWRTLKSGEGVRLAGGKMYGYHNGSEQTVHFRSLIRYPRG